MRTDYPKYFITFSILLLLTWSLSCSGRAGKKLNETSNASSAPSEEVARFIKMIYPEENAEFKLGDQVKVLLEVTDKKNIPDSVTVYFDSKYVTTLKSEPWAHNISANYTVTTGRKSLKVTAYKSGKPQNPITRFMIVYSDVVPKRYGFKVIHTYLHNRDAFTQGLIYDNGILLEGTGEESGSSLREVELETGKVIRQHNLDPSLFGEGIALLNNRIFQVTWQDRVGFVYDKTTFNVINRIYYSTEGWGLTTLDDRIVMSDGTNILYFCEPEMFTVVSRIEVYDNKEKVDSLNELEYINGEIWANIWMSDRIARIDPASGKVTGYIYLDGLLPENDKNSGTDVLNGIAWDNKGNRLFVTGKRWPKLFEIKITE